VITCSSSDHLQVILMPAFGSNAECDRGSYLQHGNRETQVQVILRPSVSRPVRLGVGPHIFITVGHLRSSCCGAPSLTIGRVGNLLVQFAVTLRSKSCTTHGHFLLSLLRLLCSLSVSSYDSQGLPRKNPNLPPHRVEELGFNLSFLYKLGSNKGR
jgi:hypothetical protein